MRPKALEDPIPTESEIRAAVRRINAEASGESEILRACGYSFAFNGQHLLTVFLRAKRTDLIPVKEHEKIGHAIGRWLRQKVRSTCHTKQR